MYFIQMIFLNFDDLEAAPGRPDPDLGFENLDKNSNLYNISHYWGYQCHAGKAHTLSQLAWDRKAGNSSVQ